MKASEQRTRHHGSHAATISWLADADPARMNYLSMITGPSRTADIERVLTIGVHGPVRLIIIFVDELGRTN